MSYTAPQNNPIRDTSENSAVSLSDESVTNETPDTTAPALSSATVNGTTLVLTYNEALDDTSTPAASDFEVTVASSDVTVNNVAVSGATVTLTLATAAAHGDTVTLDYTPPASGAIQDAAGNDAASLSGQSVTNNTADSAAPALSSATVNGATLVLTYDEALDETSTPAAGDFAVTVADSAVTVSDVAVSGATVTLTLSPGAGHGDTVSISYTAPQNNPIRDTSENNADSLTDESVINETPDTTAPTLSSATVNGAALTLTYNEDLDETSTPAASDFTVTVADSARAVSGVAVDGAAVTLTLSSPVGHGEQVTLSYAAPPNNPIRDASENNADSLSDESVTNETPDTTAPALSSATVNGATLTLTYDEDLDEISTPATSDFEVTVAGNAVTVSDVAVSGATVTLTLTTGAGHDETVSISYTAPPSNPIRDASENNADSLSDESVTNNTPDTTAPALSSATVSGATLTLTYDEDLDETSTPATDAFEVTVAGSVVTLSGVAIDGVAVTLTLATPAAHGDTVSLDYTPPASGAIQDESGNDAAALTGRPVSNNTPDTRLPSLSSATVSGATLTLTYDEDLDDTSTPAAGDFAVTVADSAVTVSDVAVSGATVTLTLSTAVEHGETVSVSYTAPQSNPIRDTSENSAASLVDQSVTNETPDTTAPALSSATVSGATLVLTYDETLDDTSTPAAGDFAVTVADSAVTVSDVAVSGATVTLTLTTGAGHGETVSISYTAPQTSPIRDTSENNADSLSDESVSNETPDTTAPALSSATVNGATLVLTYDEALDETSTPAAGDFAVTVADSAVTVSDVAVSGATVTLTLSPGAGHGDTVSISYTAPQNNPIRDTSENNADSLTDESVINETPDTTAPTLSSATVNGAALTLTYNEDLDETSTPAASDFTVTVADSARAVSGVAVDGAAVTLTLSSPVGHGEQVTLSYAAPPNNPIRDASENNADSLSDESVTNETPDTTAPALSSATVNGATLTLTYDEDLDEISTPATSAFEVTVAGNAVTVSDVAVSGATVTLTLTTGAGHDETVSISYTAPPSNPIRDTSENSAVSLTDESVTNETPDTTAPALSSATVNGAALTLTYDEDLDETSTPAAGDFAVTVADSAVTVSDVAVSGATVTLTLSPGAGHGETVSISYTAPPSNPIRDTSENNAASLADQSVTNDTPDTTAPALSSATVNGAELVLTYDEDLDESSTPAAGDFAVTVADTAVTVSDVAVSGATVTLTLSPGAGHDETVSISYTAPPSNPIRDTSENNAGSLTDESVTNETPDTTAPALSGATVNGATLVLTYNEDLDETSTPGAGDFTVTVVDSARAVSSVAINGAAVTLTLSSPVGHAEQVTLSYAAPQSNPIRDTSENNAGSLTDESVTNETPDTTAPALSSATVNGAELVLTYDEDLDETSTPAAGDFAVTVADSAVAVSDVAVSGATVTLTLSTGAGHGETVSISYTPSQSNPIRDTSENNADSLSDESVTNETPDTTAPTLSSATVNGVALVLTYDEDLDETSTPAAGDFAVTVADSSVAVSGVAIDGAAVTLTLSTGAEHDDTVTLDYTAPSIGAIRDPAGNEAEDLDGQVVTNDTPDTTAPALSAATINGALLVLTFSESLDGTFTPAGADFTVTVEDSAVSVSDVAVNGNEVTLTLATPAGHGEAVSVSYTVPETGQIQDDSGNLAAAVSEFTVINSTPDTTAPVLSAAAVDLDSLVLTYDEDLDENSVPATSAFEVTVNDSAVALNNVAVQAATVTVTLAAPVPAGQAVTLSYRVPTGALAQPLADAAGNAVAALTAQPVTNATRGVLISPTELEVPEGDEATYTVAITTEPSDNVTVVPSVSGSPDVTVSPASLSFTPGDWADVRTVTVSAGHDPFTEDDIATISHAVSGGDYAAVTAGDVSVTVVDDDSESTSIALGVDPASVSEDAGSTLVTVTATLNAAPRPTDTDVTVTVGALGDTATADKDYAAVSDFTLTIEAGETSGSADFTLTPTVDGLDEGDELITVSGDIDAIDLSVTDTTVTIANFTNKVPAFAAELPRSLEVAENSEPDTDIGDPVAATDEDGHRLSYRLEGVDAESFTIDGESGQLRTLEALDYEARQAYSVTVKADDGHFGTATLAVTLKVTDIDEQPGTPAAPRVLAATGRTTALSLRWRAPDTNGGPAITGYELQYRAGVNGDWNDHRHVGTRTRATISGLTAATQYQSRVRALNGETPGEWSEPGSGRTGRTDNTAPEFDDELPLTLEVAENTEAGTDLGIPFTASDNDGDSLTYLLEGADRHAFAIDAQSGQLSTVAPLDRESKADYTLTLRADDGNGGSDRLGLSISITNLEEQAGTPDAPLVLASRGSTTSLEVTWRAPDTGGGPAISGYEVQYRPAPDTENGPDTVTDTGSATDEDNPWIAHRHLGAGERTVIEHLEPGTAYEARVRALNGEIAGDWSDPGSGSTGAQINAPPVFDGALPVELHVDENTAAGIDIGEPFTATDGDGDTLTYLLEGAGADTFTIDPESGQLRTSAPLDHESRANWPLRIRADDGRGGADLIRVTLRVRDVDEQAPPLSAPGVLATAGSTTGIDLRWSAPGPNGSPAVTGYEVQYREGAAGDWTDHAHEGAASRSTIAELTADTDYQARVRALNGEISGDWSEPGMGRTGRADNGAPEFDSDLPAMLSVDENTPGDTDIGAPFLATDADGDTLTYLIGGADGQAFGIDPDTGQLRTRSPLDHEARPSYSLTLRVSDGAGGVDTLELRVEIADLDEPPAQPLPPLVLASAGSTTGVDLRWRRPHANGGPPVTGYEVQYREGADGEWVELDHEGADTRAMIDALAVSTGYQARIRALNDEGTGAWSDPGTGNTGRDDNRAPEFADETATRSVAENSPANEPVGAPFTAVDADRDSLTYTLNGMDADIFDIDPQTGQILTSFALDYETSATHEVTVTAWDGAGGADTIEVTIEVIDTLERESLLGPEAPTGVTLGRLLSLDEDNVQRAQMTLRWNAPGSEVPSDQSSGQSPVGETWFEFRLGRYPEPSNGMTAPAFQCAPNRAFEPDGWRRIPDSGPDGANARSWTFDAEALGCYLLADTFELRAQVRAVEAGSDGASPRPSLPSTEARTRDEAPRVAGLWLDTANIEALAAGDELAITVAFTEPVRVAGPDGSPTLGIEIGGETHQAVFSGATKPPLFRDYGSGAIGSRLEFRYEVQDGDDPAAGIAVPANAISLSGGASILDATGPVGHAAILANAATTLMEGSIVLAAAPEESLTAGFEPDSVPDTHDGETTFSLGVSFAGSAAADGTGQDDQQATETTDELEGLTLVAESFLVTGGRITAVSRVTDGDNGHWTVDLEPESKAEVSISLGPTPDCDAAGAVCTTDGRSLSNNIHAVVKGPPGISVADAQVREGPGAMMDFAVTLSRALDEAVSVDYATADGTATAGEDYTGTSGTLTFEPGEITKTVSVEVLDDSHDDDGETFTLTLSDPSGGNAHLVNDTATGTIQNSDPMPKAWIARFGRTVSEHLVDAIQARLRDRGRPAPESHFTLGGLRLDGLFSSRDDGHAEPHVGAAGEATWPGESRWMADPGLAGGNAAGVGPVPGQWGMGTEFGAAPSPDSAIDGGAQPGSTARTAAGRGPPSLRDILMGSSFHYTSAGDGAEYAGGFRDWSVWGRTASTQFRGADGPLSLEGAVDTGMIGTDALWNRWTLGLVLAHSEGRGGFTHRTASGGAIESRLTSLHPFVQYRFSERTSVWGTLGYGLGDLSLTPEGAESGIDTDLAMRMAALGGRGVLGVRTGKAGSFELAVRSDAMFSETVSGASENLLAASGAASRVRASCWRERARCHCPPAGC